MLSLYEVVILNKSCFKQGQQRFVTERQTDRQFGRFCLSQLNVFLCSKHGLFGQRPPQVKTPKLVNSSTVGGGDFGPSGELMWF